MSSASAVVRVISPLPFVASPVSCLVITRSEFARSTDAISSSGSSANNPEAWVLWIFGTISENWELPLVTLFL